ncbi:DUF6382 domain-containing protein [Paenibacillus sp. FA6]|uniref:DUF6382 domain-containing protein n=1 Tax=Paenibacillus sp. FA6 TaxID=3413029 RepID=UPI003F655C7E
MFGLTQDFIHNGGNYMILDSPEGLTSSELNRVQTSMITATKIPHLLSLRLKEINFKVSLQYDITDKKMLTHLLKSEKLTMEEFYDLLLQLVNALEESTSYMLDQDKYIIQEDYIFVEGPLHIGKLYLTYYPIQSLKNPEPLESSLSKLITRLMTSVSELQGNGIQTLLQYMSVEGYALSGMRGLLLNLLAQAGEQSPSKPTHNSMPPSNSYRPDPDITPDSHSILTRNSTPIRSTKPYEPDLFSQPVAKRAEGVYLERKVGLSAASFQMDNQYDNDLKDEDGDYEPGPIATYVSLGCLVACALAWRYLYMAYPGTGMLIVSILVTGLLGAIAWMGWKGKIRMPMKGAEPLTESVALFDSRGLGDSSLIRKKASFQVERLTGFFGGSSKDKELEPSRERWVFPDNPKTERTQTDAVNEIEDEASSSVGETEDDYYAKLGHRTEMLSSPRVNATVLLMPENNIIQGNNGVIRHSNPYLERREMGQVIKAGLMYEDSAQGDLPSVRIELNHPHFIIGRAAEVAQFVEETPGTSRAHVELSKGSEGYVIKDLGSKNGTLLNKELMVSYKEYLLNDGDIFTIVKGEYTYHMMN